MEILDPGNNEAVDELFGKMFGDKPGKKKETEANKPQRIKDLEKIVNL